jgi:ABC-2 type transport system permease protein
VWAIIAVSLAAVGADPQVRLVGWLAVVAAFAITLLGPLFQLWDWVLGISPLWHVPNVTDAGVDFGGLGWVGLVAALLIVVGFVGFRRRDVI